EVPEQLRITSDRELLTLILQNLLGNAIKYSTAGTIRVTATGDCTDGAACRISVIDQGPGIDPQKLSELFRSYTRGETHGQAGTGLGLSIARQAAEHLGAKLWAESNPGNGTVFHLELPGKTE